MDTISHKYCRGYNMIPSQGNCLLHSKSLPLAEGPVKHKALLWTK